MSLLLPSQRRRRIADEINRSGAQTVAALSAKYDVSETTIRRDLKLLEEDGQIKRTHGGAINQQAAHEPAPVVAREKRKRLRAKQKREIARYVSSELIADGDIIALGGGTTVSALIPRLGSKQELTVITNGLATASELHAALPRENGITILCSGGILRPVSGTFVGPVAEAFFHQFHVNNLFLSATGLTPEAGVTDPNMLETQVKRAMLAAASRLILLLDSSKFGVKSLLTVLDVEEIDILVTDEGIAAQTRSALEARGVDVRVAPAEEAS